MGHTKAAGLLGENLNEEKAADEKLSALAEGGINQQAAKAAHAGEARQTASAGGPGRTRK